MISNEQEERIRFNLGLGKSGPMISDLVGVSTDAVYAVKRVVTIASSLTTGQRRKIKELSGAGVQLSAISKKVRVERYVVRAVRRFYYHHLPKSARFHSIQCLKCGAIRASDEKFTGARFDLTRIGCSLNFSDTKAMFRIVEDLAAMGSCDISLNPLISNLVSDSKKIVEKIRAKNSSDR